MESTRLSKIERLLQKELSDIFQKQTQAMHGILISVSVVRVSPDLSVARAYLSIFPSDKSKEMLENIRANTKAIRFDLGQRIEETSPTNPFNTDSAHTKAIVATTTPQTDTIEIILMALWDFFEKR